MKAKIKLKDSEQLRELINFVHGLNGKRVKVKESRKEVLNFPKLTDQEKIDKLDSIALPYDWSNTEDRIKNRKPYDQLKAEIKELCERKREECRIHLEGLKCHPNCVNGTLYNCNGTEETKCKKCITSYDEYLKGMLNRIKEPNFYLLGEKNCDKIICISVQQ